MSVSCECCMLSGRSPCVGLTIRLEKSYRMCVYMCLSVVEEPRRGDLVLLGLSSHGKNESIHNSNYKQLTSTEITFSSKLLVTHTHTNIYIYIYIYFTLKLASPLL